MFARRDLGNRRRDFCLNYEKPFSADAEYWVFHAALTNLPPGDRVLRVRAFYTSPPEILDSDPVTVTVDAPPTYAQVLNLTQDLVLSGSQSLQLVGTTTPGGRLRINGNGFRIRTSGTWTGHFTLRYADVCGLGKLNDGQLALDVTTKAPLALENCCIWNNPLLVAVLVLTFTQVIGATRLVRNAGKPKNMVDVQEGGRNMDANDPDATANFCYGGPDVNSA